MSSVIIHHLNGTARNVLCGMSLCYVVKKEQFVDIPAILLFPAVYAGYRAYENKDAIVGWMREVTARRRWF